ncbi:Chromosome 5 4 [Globomyces sp. JEL0801]|nr:Chromosome 5 4 [Globomyces sp. JEL0801]
MAYGIIEEVWFYYSHRLLHHPSIYRFIHKRHHLFTAPVGMAATFAHPFEHLVSNMAPMVLGPIIMQSHIAVSWIWFNFAIIVTITTHCGYDLWGFPSSLAHDFHHYSFNYNFGVAGILDFLHGTDSAYQVWLAEYRCRDKAKEALNEISNKEE